MPGFIRRRFILRKDSILRRPSKNTNKMKINGVEREIAGAFPLSLSVPIDTLKRMKVPKIGEGEFTVVMKGKERFLITRKNGKLLNVVLKGPQ